MAKKDSKFGNTILKTDEDWTSAGFDISDPTVQNYRSKVGTSSLKDAQAFIGTSKNIAKDQVGTMRDGVNRQLGKAGYNKATSPYSRNAVFDDSGKPQGGAIVGDFNASKIRGNPEAFADESAIIGMSNAELDNTPKPSEDMIGSYLASYNEERANKDLAEVSATPEFEEVVSTIKSNPSIMAEVKSNVDNGNTDEYGIPLPPPELEKSGFSWDILATVLSAIGTGLSGGVIPFIPFTKLGLDVTANRQNRQAEARAFSEGRQSALKQAGAGEAYKANEETVDKGLEFTGKQNVSENQASINMNQENLSSAVKQLGLQLNSQERIAFNQIAATKEMKQLELDAQKVMQEMGFAHNQTMATEIAAAQYKAYLQAQSSGFKGSFADYMKAQGGSTFAQEMAKQLVGTAGQIASTAAAAVLK